MERAVGPLLRVIRCGKAASWRQLSRTVLSATAIREMFTVKKGSENNAVAMAKKSKIEED
jgi:hypothetical protein